MDQPWLLRAELCGIKTVPVQITRAFVREEDVRVLQQTIELRAIFLGVIQGGGAHAHLCIPGKGLDLDVVWLPDVENIGAVHCEISANRRSRDHVPHSEGANAIEGIPSVFREGYGIAFADLFHRDERHRGKDLGVLTLLEKFLVRAHLGQDKTGFGRGVLQLVRIPLQDGILDGSRLSVHRRNLSAAVFTFG